MSYKFSQLFIPLVIILLLIIYFKNSNGEVTTIKSNFDGRVYVVQNKKDKKNAAELLAKTREKLISLIEGLKQKHKDDERVDRLSTKFQPDKISEGNEDSNYTTYTLNKGEKIVFCLRTRDKNDNLHDLNMITFVAIHELSHIMTKSTGHTEEFQQNFEFILKEAVALGLYKPENYRENPTNYCGIPVTDTPLNDSYFKKT